MTMLPIRTRIAAAILVVMAACAAPAFAQGQLNVICPVQAEWCSLAAIEFEKETGIKVGMTLKGSGESFAQIDECRVTASVGACLYPKDSSDERSLMKNADLAMYKAKEEGKNNYQFYSKAGTSKALRKISIETQMRRAIEKNELSMHYQAKRDMQTGAITGVEALLRWKNAVLGVLPTHFFPVAEETGLIVPIGRWAMFTACAQNMAWQKAGLPAICMAVNSSPSQFADPGLLADIAQALESTGLAPELLELEITESMVFHDTKQAVERLQAIKKMGVRLAIDAFGTGYSSLAELKRFSIDTLKVDRSFIREIPNEAEDKAITEAIIAMAKA